MITQPSMFEEDKPADACVTCGAVRPDDYTRTFWTEPVSGECGECNYATVMEILRAGQAGDREAMDVAWTRHLRRSPKALKRNRR